MRSIPKIRTWRAIAALTAILALILLLLPHATNYHGAPDLVFLLVPLFLFAELIDRSVPYQSRKNHVVAPNRHVRSTLFQRPPPSQA